MLTILPTNRFDSDRPSRDASAPKPRSQESRSAQPVLADTGRVNWSCASAESASDSIKGLAPLGQAARVLAPLLAAPASVFRQQISSDVVWPPTDAEMRLARSRVGLRQTMLSVHVGTKSSSASQPITMSKRSNYDDSQFLG
jgi:hypothetical protein